MAKPTAGKGKPTSTRDGKTNSCLYLGCFTFSVPREGNEEHDGTFQIVAEASTPEKAVEVFRARLNKLRDTSTLFSSPTTVYLEGFIKLSGSYKKGVLVNYEQGPAPPPPNGRILALVPEQPDDHSESYDWHEGPEAPANEDGSITIEPFVDYGGEALRKALHKASVKTPPARSLPARELNPISRSPGPMTPGERVERERARRQAKSAKARRAAVSATLAELGPANKGTKAKGSKD